MASGTEIGIQGQLRQILRYSVRLLPIIIIVAVIAWFFLFRAPDEQTNTSGSSDTPPDTITEVTKTEPEPESKVADNSAAAKTTEENEAEDGKLPETGPADSLAIFMVAAIAGTLFWEWRLRRVQRNSTTRIRFINIP